MTSSPKTIDVDEDLELLNEQLRALRALGARNDDDDDDDDDEPVTEGRRYDFSIRWGTAMAGRLRRLAHYSALGKLDSDDERRFAMLCAELRSLSDLIDRFGLAQPRFSDSPPATAKRFRRSRRMRR